ncbi:hypothetical protein V6N11_037209 [Hibiscus sabdariffa]|uniref:Uncharacterized protein n=1 Tax=Hibiscus sabdariffa TaxID=183260 RepID=A0ABR2P0S9_9ROSI
MYRDGRASREVGPDTIYDSARLMQSKNAPIPNMKSRTIGIMRMNNSVGSLDGKLPACRAAFQVLAEKSFWHSASLDCSCMFAAELLGEYA